MKGLITTIKGWLMGLGILRGDSGFLDTLISILIIALAAYLCDYICRKAAVLFLHIHSKIKARADEDTERHRKLLSSFAAILPPMLINILLPIAFDAESVLKIWTERLCSIYTLVMIVMFLFALLDFVQGIAKKRMDQNYPINIFFQICHYLIIILALIIGFGILLNKSPYALLTGVGASAAILSIVFKDSLVGLVSSMQLMGNKMLKINDWISVPKYNADGRVTEITLNTVKIRNWDGTISTLPPSALLNDSFQNWSSMVESEGRRIKRSINIDIHSIRFCTAADLERYKSIPCLKKLISENKVSQEEETEAKKKADEDFPGLLSASSITNLTLFSAYLEDFIATQSQIRESDDKYKHFFHFVRQLQPTENGLPLEIYFFTKETEWVAYEKATCKVMEHVLASVNYFGLSILQRASGNVEER